MASEMHFRSCKFCWDNFSGENLRQVESQRDSHEASCPQNHNIMEDDED